MINPLSGAPLPILQLRILVYSSLFAPARAYDVRVEDLASFMWPCVETPVLFIARIIPPFFDGNLRLCLRRVLVNGWKSILGIFWDQGSRSYSLSAVPLVRGD